MNSQTPDSLDGPIRSAMTHLAGRAEPSAGLADRALRDATVRRRTRAAAALTAGAAATAAIVALPLLLSHSSARAPAAAARTTATSAADILKRCMRRNPSLVTRHDEGAAPPSNTPGLRASDFRVLVSQRYAHETLALVASSKAYQFCVLDQAGAPDPRSVSPRSGIPAVQDWSLLGDAKSYSDKDLPTGVITGFVTGAGTSITGHFPAQVVRVTASRNGEPDGVVTVSHGWFVWFGPRTAKATKLPGGTTSIGPDPTTTFRGYDASGHLVATTHDSP
jgi:hypothetical protein